MPVGENMPFGASIWTGGDRGADDGGRGTWYPLGEGELFELDPDPARLELLKLGT